MPYKSVFHHSKLVMIDERTDVKTTIMDKDVALTFSLSNGKESVNTGQFVPGQYRVNPYKVWKEEVVGAPFFGSIDFVVSRYYHYYSDVSGNIMDKIAAQNMSTTLPSVASTLANSALQQAYSKVRQSELMLGEDLGELRETFEMLKHPFKSLTEFFLKDGGRNISRLQFLINALRQSRATKGRLAAETASVAASTWLEFQYGFKPLVMTISDLLELIRKKHNSMFDPNTIRCARAKKSTTEKTSSPSTSSVFEYTRVYYDKVTIDNIDAYASVQYKQETPLGLLGRLGLAPEYLIETAWNLTTLSFVVDWLFDVGTFLGSYRVNPGVSVLGNTVGVKVDRNVSVKATKWHCTLNPSAEKKTATKGSYTYQVYERKINQSLPLLPQFQAGRLMNLTKSISAVALTWQLILSKFVRKRV